MASHGNFSPQVGHIGDCLHIQQSSHKTLLRPVADLTVDEHHSPSWFGICVWLTIKLPSYRALLAYGNLHRYHRGLLRLRKDATFCGSIDPVGCGLASCSRRACWNACRRELRSRFLEARVGSGLWG